MPTFNNMQGLDRYVKMSIQQALRQVAKETAEFLSQTVHADIYRKPESDYYDRTREFLEAITQSNIKQIGNEFQIEIYFDTDKINPYMRRGRFGANVFNAHMSLNDDTSYNGRSIGDWLVEWLEEGYSGGVRPPQEGMHFLEETREWLRDEIDLILIKVFKKAGIQISVR